MRLSNLQIDSQNSSLLRLKSLTVNCASHSSMSSKESNTSLQSNEVSGFNLSTFPKGILPYLGKEYGDAVDNYHSNTNTNTNTSAKEINVTTSSSEDDSDCSEEDSCEVSSDDETIMSKKKKAWKCKNKSIQIGFIKDSFQSYKFNGKKVCIYYMNNNLANDRITTYTQYDIDCSGEERIVDKKRNKITFIPFDNFMTAVLLFLSVTSGSNTEYHDYHFDIVKLKGKGISKVYQQKDFEKLQFQVKLGTNKCHCLYVTFSNDISLENCQCRAWELTSNAYRKQYHKLHNHGEDRAVSAKTVKASNVLKEKDLNVFEAAKSLVGKGMNKKQAILAALNDDLSNKIDENIFITKKSALKNDGFARKYLQGIDAAKPYASYGRKEKKKDEEIDWKARMLYL